jgi:hypothetical protein
MKYYMGHFGQAEIPQPTSTQIIPGMTFPVEQPVVNIPYAPTVVGTASDLASQSLESTFEKAAALAKTEEIQAFIKENNLDPYLQDINKERVKNILAIIGLIWLGKLAKSPVGLTAIGAMAIYVMFSNKDKLIEKISIREA